MENDEERTETQGSENRCPEGDRGYDLGLRMRLHVLSRNLIMAAMLEAAELIGSGRYHALYDAWPFEESRS
jgi:hypothetical protein